MLNLQVQKKDPKVLSPTFSDQINGVQSQKIKAKYLYKLDGNIGGMISKFSDDTKVGGVV